MSEKLAAEFMRLYRANPIWPMRDQSPAAWHPSQGGEPSLFQDALSEIDVTGSGIMKDKAVGQAADGFRGLLKRRSEIKKLADALTSGSSKWERRVAGQGGKVTPVKTLRKNLAQTIRDIRQAPQEMLDPVSFVEAVDQPYADAMGQYTPYGHYDKARRGRVGMNLAELDKTTFFHELNHAWKDKLGKMKDVFIGSTAEDMVVNPKYAPLIEKQADIFAQTWYDTFKGSKVTPTAQHFKDIYKQSEKVAKLELAEKKFADKLTLLYNTKPNMVRNKKLRALETKHAKIWRRHWEEQIKLRKYRNEAGGPRLLEGELMSSHQQYDPYAKFAGPKAKKPQSLADGLRQFKAGISKKGKK